MLFKDIDGNCELCCLKNTEFCAGGYVCYGGEPVEPPCAVFPEHEDDEELYDFLTERNNRYEEWQDSIIKAEQEKQKKREQVAQKRREYKYRNYSDILTIREKQKQIRKIKKYISFVSSFNSAVSSVNNLFEISGIGGVPDKRPLDLTKYEGTIVLLEQQVKTIKEKIKEKEKIFKKQQEKNNELHK